MPSMGPSKVEILIIDKESQNKLNNIEKGHLI